MARKVSKHIFNLAVGFLVVHIAAVSIADISQMVNLGQISLATKIAAFSGLVSVPVLGFFLALFIERAAKKTALPELSRLVAMLVLSLALISIVPILFQYASALADLPLAQLLQLGTVLKWATALISISVASGLILLGISISDLLYKLTTRVRFIGTRVILLLLVVFFSTFLWLGFLSAKAEQLLEWAMINGYLDQYLDPNLWANVTTKIFGTLASGMSVLLPFILILAWRFGFRLSEGITELGDGFQRISDGNLEQPVPVLGNDEVADMQKGFNQMLDAMQERRFLENAFGQYVSPVVLEKIRGSADLKLLEGEKLDASVLFSDIRGFTALSANMDPEEVISLLNQYMTRMIDVIEHHGGYINKFVGDAIMVVWNTPVHHVHHALLAASCANQMQNVLREANEEGVFGEHSIEMGIGINTGSLVAGNLGDARQVEFTVIGDTVNVSSRACSEAAERQVAVTEPTLEHVKKSVADLDIPLDADFDSMGEIALKGKGMTHLYLVDPKFHLGKTDLEKVLAI